MAEPEATKQVRAIPERLDNRKLEVEERQRKRRYAERKAMRQAARALQQREQRQPRGRENAPILAFGGDNSERLGGGLFGN